MSSLIVLLPPRAADASTEFEYALTADGTAAQSHGNAVAALLPQPRGAGSEVVAIAPATAVSWQQVELPKGLGAGSSKLRPALEGLLEERLLDDAEALHFALQPQARAGGPQWVAVCDRDWLRRCLQVLEQAGRPASRVVPEFVPGASPVLHAVGDPQHASWVVTSETGVLVLPLSTGTLPLLPALPEDAPRIAEPAVATLAEQLLHQKVQLLQPAQRWVQAAQGAWDLAQFEFASTGRARAFKRLSTGWADLVRAPQWRPARWAAALLVVANLVGLNAWAWKERAAMDAKRETIRLTLTTTFPNVKTVVEPRLQMERELALLRQAAGVPSGRDLESLLAAVATATPPGRVATGLDYNGTELRVRGLAFTPAELAAATQSLRAQGVALTAQGDVLVLAQEDVR